MHAMHVVVHCTDKCSHVRTSTLLEPALRVEQDLAQACPTLPALCQDDNTQAAQQAHRRHLAHVVFLQLDVGSMQVSDPKSSLGCATEPSSTVTFVPVGLSDLKLRDETEPQLLDNGMPVHSSARVVAPQHGHAIHA